MGSIYEPSYAPPREPPFPVGTSPFRQKGAAYLADERYYDATLPGGFRGLLAQAPDPLRAFFLKGFRASEWYDAYPGAMLEALAARVRSLPFEQHRVRTGTWHAEDAVKGIYGALLKLVSNENVATWAPRISGIYFEFGKTETRVAGPRLVTGLRRGVPVELAQWLMFASAGFGTEFLRRAGGRNAKTEIGEVTPDGRSYGRDLVKVELRLTWD